VAMFIMVASAAAIGTHAVTQIESAAQAASALRPVAGDLAFAVFAAGIVGTGLLAVPVLAGSAAYALAGAFGWKNSLALRYGEAKKFYRIIVAATLLGTALCFTRIDPMQALYWSAVLNGVVAVPVMVVVMRLAANGAVMGKLRITRSLAFWGWLCTAVMAAAVAAMFWTMLASPKH
ncbi:MAG: divalent metal cation transporter, partial [Burkholderiaceae bacterium]|nr:divalent metal cation transporter [Burkholderiaceae bacterium]